MQFLFLTPKPAIFPEPPANRPYIGAIFGSNVLCLLLHMWYNAPSAGEATRGYLHGGLAMDFIGQKGPSSKVHLALLDILVLVLQIVHLSAYVLRQRLKDNLTEPVTVPTVPATVPAASTGQDLDHEERGVRRSIEQQQNEEIEMQNLNPSGRSTAIDPAEANSSEREALLASTAMPQRSDAHIFDAFNSGQIVIADLDVWKTVREQFLAYSKSAPDTERAERNRLMRQRLAARALQWRFGAVARGTV